MELIWEIMQNNKLGIFFAHETFKWSNVASKNAGVNCVVVGLARAAEINKRQIIDENVVRSVQNIGPYLIDMPDLVVRKKSRPCNGLPAMSFGNMANDGGALILSPEEKQALCDNYPETSQFIRRIFGGQEFLRSVERYCLWIPDERLSLAMSIEPIKARIKQVQKTREESNRPPTRLLARVPHRFGEIRHKESDAILIPQLSSVRREWFACGFLDSSAIIIAPSLAIYDAEPYVFGLLSSKLHMCWIRTVCGKFKTDYRYSNLLGYNTFPIPILSDAQKHDLEGHAWDIVTAREAHPGKTIAWLYDPDTMPDNLLAAHKALDDTLEKIYIGRPFKDDTERLEHLFKLYAEMTAQKEEEAVNA